MALSRNQVRAVDTVLRWATGVPTPGQRLPSTDEALAAATHLALAARRANVLAANDGPVITATQLADRWPSTPPAGERATTVAAAVGVLHRLADDIAAVSYPGEQVPATDMEKAVRERAAQIQTTGVVR